MEDPTSAGAQAWSDRLELAELLAVLSSAVDRADPERIAACYAEDSFDDHGTFKGTGQQFAEFVSRPGPMSTMHHLLGQSVFEVEGDEAWGETFYVFHGTRGHARCRRPWSLCGLFPSDQRGLAAGLPPRRA